MQLRVAEFFIEPCERQKLWDLPNTYELKLGPQIPGQISALERGTLVETGEVRKAFLNTIRFYIRQLFNRFPALRPV